MKFVIMTMFKEIEVGVLNTDYKYNYVHVFSCDENYLVFTARDSNKNTNLLIYRILKINDKVRFLLIFLKII